MKRTLYITALVLFFVNILLSSILWLSFREGYYDKKYEQLKVHETIGISEEELDEVTHHLLGYIKGKYETLDYTVTINGTQQEMFNQKEKDHMVDVKVLYQRVILFRSVSAIFVAFMVVISLGNGDYKNLKYNTENVKQALGVVGVILAFIGVFALLDFNGFWIMFHQLIFTNDLWLLNPATDRLILMVPQPFFMGLVYRILVVSGLLLGGSLLIYFIMKRMSKYDTYSSL